LPESTASLFKEDEKFSVIEDRDLSDYIYRIKDLIVLEGKKYDGKRNLIKRFRSENQYVYNTFDESMMPECLEFEERWCDIKGCDRVEGLKSERLAMEEMAQNFSNFNLFGGGIRIEGKLTAAVIAEELNPSTIVTYILKADPNITGLYQAMLNEFLSREAKGYEFVDLEEDLGLPGLRKAKLSYHPCRLIPKFTIDKKREDI
jgi:hypothetical protein